MMQGKRLFFKSRTLNLAPFTLNLNACIMSVYSKKYNGFIQME